MEVPGAGFGVGRESRAEHVAAHEDGGDAGRPARGADLDPCVREPGPSSVVALSLTAKRTMGLLPALTGPFTDGTSFSEVPIDENVEIEVTVCVEHIDIDRLGPRYLPTHR